MSEPVGFIELGIIGQGMIRNLLKAGFDFSIWNRAAKRMEPIVESAHYILWHVTSLQRYKSLP
jgi:3-hydroxyisobutyrate dehydrogenase-like beta-hydroxyacid dehydrogenase